MADITDECVITGGGLAVSRPFDWHTWNVLVPYQALGGAGPDQIILPDLFHSGTRLLEMTVQITNNISVGTSMFLDVEQALKVIEGGAISGTTTIISSIDLEVEDTTYLASGDTVIEDFGNANDAINKRIISLEITKVGAVATDCEFIVAALLGRNTV